MGAAEAPEAQGSTMVKELSVMEKSKSFWARSRCAFPCGWMMQVVNMDMLMSATEHDLELLTKCVYTGGWQDFTDQDGNTALHLAVAACVNFKEHAETGKKFGLRIEDDVPLIETPLKSQLKLGTAEARKQIQQEIAKWH